MKTLNVRVSRFDPDVDKAPHFGTYQVPYEDDMSVLMVMKHIYEQDGLVFRHSCDVGLCTICTVKVNGKAKLPCKTIVKDTEFELVIEPQKPQVLRDLVVDVER